MQLGISRDANEGHKKATYPAWSFHDKGAPTNCWQLHFGKVAKGLGKEYMQSKLNFAAPLYVLHTFDNLPVSLLKRQ